MRRPSAIASLAGLFLLAPDAIRSQEPAKLAFEVPSVIFTALQEQLGLKLEAKRLAINVAVVGRRISCGPATPLKNR